MVSTMVLDDGSMLSKNKHIYLYVIYIYGIYIFEMHDSSPVTIPSCSGVF